MEKEVCNRIKSICYKDENIFRKYYRYSNDPSVDREGKIANILLKEEFPVAKHYKTGYSDENQMRFNEFDFVEINSITEDDIDKEVVSKALSLIKHLQKVKYVEDGYWNSYYEKDLIRCLEYSPNLKNDSIKLLAEIKNYPKMFLHGDFSLKNFGYRANTKDLFLYDFQTACNGPIDWDIAYFMATLSIPYSNLFEYDERILAMIKLITAVRLGRGSRRNIELKRRSEIQEYWWSK